MAPNCSPWSESNTTTVLIPAREALLVARSEHGEGELLEAHAVPIVVVEGFDVAESAWSECGTQRRAAMGRPGIGRMRIRQVKEAEVRSPRRKFLTKKVEHGVDGVLVGSARVARRAEAARDRCPW